MMKPTNNLRVARLKILAHSMIMAGIFVYLIKIPYLAFLMGGVTVTINNHIWDKRWQK